MLIQDIALKTSREQWTIETGDKRGSGRSVLVAQHDDDDGNQSRRKKTLNSNLLNSAFKKNFVSHPSSVQGLVNTYIQLKAI